MSAFKSITGLLDGSPSGIITKSAHIAKHMTNNTNFPVPPVTPAGLQTAVIIEENAKQDKRRYPKG